MASVRIAVLAGFLVLVAAAGVAARGEEPAVKPPPAAEAVKVPTPRGIALEASLHRPAKGNGVAVVLAPGQGYHRERPILARSAESLAAAGFVALRFDWAFFTAKGQASSDLANERTDVEAALAYVRQIEGVQKVLLAGKSLGSLVALARVAEKHDDLAGVALLTFPMHPPGVPAPATAGIDRVKSLRLPVLIVQGDQDPLGDLRALYPLVADAKVPPKVVVVPGDHGFQEGGPDDPRTVDNIDLAVRALVLWARRFSGS